MFWWMNGGYSISKDCEVFLMEHDIKKKLDIYQHILQIKSLL